MKTLILFLLFSSVCFGQFKQHYKVIDGKDRTYKVSYTEEDKAPFEIAKSLIVVIQNMKINKTDKYNLIDALIAFIETVPKVSSRNLTDYTNNYLKQIYKL